MTLIFVHIPKTAGTSLIQAFHELGSFDIRLEGYDRVEHIPLWHQHALRACVTLEQHMVPNRTLQQTFSEKLWLKIFLPNENAFVCGHFYVQKYLLPAPQNTWKRLPHVRYLSVIREPLLRAISKYYYTMQKARTRSDDPISTNFAYSFPTLQSFLASTEYANIQSRYLRHLPISEYAWIGVVEEMAKSIALLRKNIPECAHISLMMHNQTTSKDFTEISALSPATINHFYMLNTEDVILYNTVRNQLLRSS